MRSLPALADAFRPAQEALWSEDEDDDEHEQSRDVLQLSRYDDGRDLDQDADDEAAGQGTPDRSQPAQRDRGEDEQQHLEARLEVVTLRDAEQGPRQTGKGGAADPHDANHLLDVDPGSRR